MTQKIYILLSIPSLKQVFDRTTRRMRSDLLPYGRYDADEQLVDKFLRARTKCPELRKVQLEHSNHERLGHGQRVKKRRGGDAHRGRVQVVV